VELTRELFLKLLDNEIEDAEKQFHNSKYESDYQKIQYKTQFWIEYGLMLQNVKISFLLKEENITEDKESC